MMDLTLAEAILVTLIISLVVLLLMHLAWREGVKDGDQNNR